MKKTAHNSSGNESMPEIDLKRAKVLGVGTYFKRMAAQNRYVQLDADLNKEFKTAEEVNEALRVVLHMRRLEQARRRRRTASRRRRRTA